MISFKLGYFQPKCGKFRNFKKANWSKFKLLLSKEIWAETPSIWSKHTIELEAKKLLCDITKILDKICPEKTITTKPSTPNWWTTDLENLKGKLQAKKRELKRLTNGASADVAMADEKHQEYKKLKKDFSKLIKSSKRDTWRKFTSECKDIYFLNKLNHKKQQCQVSMMRDCHNGSQTHKTLLDAHFPGSTNVGQNGNSITSNPHIDEADGEKVVTTDDMLDDLSFLNPWKVNEAFQDMKSLNSGGPDQMKSIVFQNLPYNVLLRISLIYKACIKLSYTPLLWCEADAIFLAKPNKARYDVPSSFRPISKFNAILKGLEKLVKWELERTSLVERPLHNNQHAYSRSKNVDTALVQVVDEAQKGILRKEFTLGVFIDIEGAFNNLNTKKALGAMRNRGFPSNLVSWYESFVTNRVVNSELFGGKIKRKINQGTPQGGVLSPLCWNVPFDELLNILNECNGIKAIGFADDLVILINGIDESTLSNLMQQAINKALPWLSKYGLSISPSKSVAIMFTNKRKFTTHPIYIRGAEIPFKNEVKYLGVTLDAKLQGTIHVTQKIGKAKKHLMAYKYAITKRYGPHPKLMKMVYKTVILPALTFGCHIFGDKCQQENIKKSLQKLNRLATLLIVGVAPSTPTKGLEIILNLIPLHLLIEKKATEIMARINNKIQPSWDGIGKGNKNSLIKRWRSKAAEITNNIMSTDKIETSIVKERNFIVHKPDDGRIRKKEANGIVSYTDGSVLRGKTGCGIHTVKGKRIIYNGNFYLGDTATVFQAEITALKKSAEMLLNSGYDSQTITFYSDSQASLAALNKLTINSDAVFKCWEALNELGKKNKVHLRWVKAHVGIGGNEVADFLAKRGSSLREGPSDEVLIPKVNQRLEIEKYFHKKWTAEWASYKEARQTKIWFPKPDYKKSHLLLNLERMTLSRLVQFFTGHNNLKRHKNIQNGLVDPLSCRLCCEDEESSFHVIAECPATETVRKKVFMLYNTSTLSNPPAWTISQVIRFLKESQIDDLLDQYENTET